MFSTDTKIRVRYKETDQMGVAHHSNYYPWFEVGRTELIREAGLSYHDMECRGIMLPVLETHCYYIHGAKYDDLLTIRTRISAFKGVRLKIEYEVIRDEDNLLLARGITVHAFTDTNLKPLNIKKSHPEIYDLFIKCMD
jgi:acyl-CoA thioester hydrolase